MDLSFKGFNFSHTSERGKPALRPAGPRRFPQSGPMHTSACTHGFAAAHPALFVKQGSNFKAIQSAKCDLAN